jgi:hypothetical protein
VEKMESFKFLGVHLTDKLKWSTDSDSVVKKLQLCLFNLGRLKKCVLPPKTLTNFYRCTIESILSGSIIAWFDNCTAVGVSTGASKLGPRDRKTASISRPSLAHRGCCLYKLSKKRNVPFSGPCLSKIISKNPKNYTDLHCKGF